MCLRIICSPTDSSQPPTILPYLVLALSLPSINFQTNEKSRQKNKYNVKNTIITWVMQRKEITLGGWEVAVKVSLELTHLICKGKKRGWKKGLGIFRALNA